MLKSIQKFFSGKKSLCILIDDCQGIGYRGEVIKVNNSFLRGVLIPQKRAVYFTKGRCGRLFNKKTRQRIQILKQQDQEQQYLKKLQKTIKINQKDNYLNDVYLKEPLKSYLKRKNFIKDIDPQNIQVNGNLREFGRKELIIKNFKSEQLRETHDLTIPFDIVFQFNHKLLYLQKLDQLKTPQVFQQQQDSKKVESFIFSRLLTLQYQQVFILNYMYCQNNSSFQKLIFYELSLLYYFTSFRNFFFRQLLKISNLNKNQKAV